MNGHNAGSLYIICIVNQYRKLHGKNVNNKLFNPLCTLFSSKHQRLSLSILIEVQSKAYLHKYVHTRKNMGGACGTKK